MKKIYGMILIVLMVISYTFICFAFPDTGKYESETRYYSEETSYYSRSIGATRDIGDAYWHLEISKLNNYYYGKLSSGAKGYWGGEWSVPLSINTNGDGRYVINVIGDSINPNGSARMELQEISDGSIIMYLTLYHEGKPWHGTITYPMNKID